MPIARRIQGPITVDGDVTVDGVLSTSGAADFDVPIAVPGNGALLTTSDFQRLQGGSALPLGTAAPVESNGWTGWQLPDAVTSGISFIQSFPSNWLTANLSWGYVPLTNIAGNVRWRARVYRVNALGIGGDLISDAPQTEVLLTQAAGTFLSMGHVFNTPSGFDLHNADAIFGEVVNITIERLGGDAADTYVGNVMVSNFSINRVS